MIAQKCLALLFALSLLGLYGCSSKISNQGVTIVYQTMETLPQQRDALQKLVQAFEQSHPSIHVKIQLSPSGFTKLQAQAAAGEMPDVFYYVSDRLPALVHRGAVLDLMPLLSKDSSVALSSFFPKIIESCQKPAEGGGLATGLYIFPFHFSTDVLFYNKDLFDKAGLVYPNNNWTWDDFALAAEQLTTKKHGTTLQYGTLQPRPLLLVKSYGGECFDQDHCVIASVPTRKSLEFLESLVAKGWAPQTAALRDVEVMDGVTLFSTGRIGMLVGRTYMLPEFAKLNNFDWDVALVPKGNRRYSRLAVGGNCISSKTQHPQEAWEFVRYFSSTEASKILGEFRNCVPADIAAANSDVFLHTPPLGIKTFIEALDTAEIENPGMVLWQEYVDKVIQPTVESMLCGDISVDQAMQEMNKKGENLIHEESNLKSR